METRLENLSKTQLLELLNQKDAELVVKDEELASKYKELASSYEETIASNEKTIASHKDTITSQKNVIINLETSLSNLQDKVSTIEAQLKELKRRLYGGSKERYLSHPDQLQLPFDVPQVTEPEKELETITYSREVKKKKQHPGRVELPEHLERVDIIIEPDDLPEQAVHIGDEVTEKLECIPAKLYVKRYIRKKYIIPTDEQDLSSKGIIAELPEFAINKGIAGESLLAQILIDKFVDHLPIYRQIERFKREGVKISSSTINGWQESVCDLLEPLYDELVRQVMSQGYIQADETPIQVLDKQKQGKTHRGYYWIYHSPLSRYVFFDYQRGRGKDGPIKLLRNYERYLQTDGYSVCDLIQRTNKGITLMGCLAHARRYFEKALVAGDKEAAYAMDLFQKLYAVEREAKEANLDAKQRKELRLEKSLPVFNVFADWIEKTRTQCLPQSLLAKAIGYYIGRAELLRVYLYDGNLEIDNNLAENAIRPIALGRKNYLFAGSDNGAKRAAMMYSFFATCKKHEVNPYLWLHKVLERIPSYKVNRLADLLPGTLQL